MPTCGTRSSTPGSARCRPSRGRCASRRAGRGLGPPGARRAIRKTRRARRASNERLNPKERAMAVNVGFIGVGNMGNPMAANVLKQFPMTVYDANPKAMENLVKDGAKRAGSVPEVVDSSEIVFTSLPASPDVEKVYLEPGGLVDRAKPGTILIDLSSVLPSTPRKIEPRAKARGVFFLEAPVSGGVSGARAATLAIMVGGDA